MYSLFDARPDHGNTVVMTPSIHRRDAVRLLAILALASPACGSTGPGVPTLPTAGIFYLSYAPDPAVASPSGEPGSDWVTRFTIRIRESGGVPVHVSRVEVGVSADPRARLTLDANAIAQRAGTSRLEPRARLDVEVELAYRAATSTSDLQVVVEGTDDRGNAVEIRGGMPVR